MTTIPGHNIVIQQSGALHEATHHARPIQPDPEKFAAEQAVKEQETKTTVQESEDSEEVKADAESGTRDRQRRNRKKRPVTDDKQEKEQDPESTGRLLDTIA